jgi:hypothetical protein
MPAIDKVVSTAAKIYFPLPNLKSLFYVKAIPKPKVCRCLISISFKGDFAILILEFSLATF